ncbi:MAG: hypothetical protein LBU61_04345, partial [Coriobacteriales bacterium]|nr:hypothetical protein [Coriobacteriales bacterium]
MFKGLNPTSKKAVIATLAISLVLIISSMTPPLLGYIMRTYPPPEYNVFLLVQVPAFVGMVVSFIAGPLALKINMKTLMAISATALFVYFMIFAFFGTTSFTALLIAVVIIGITRGSAMVLTSSIFGLYVSDPE